MIHVVAFKLGMLLSFLEFSFQYIFQARINGIKVANNYKMKEEH